MVAPVSGRAMELFTNQPGVQFYTGAACGGSTLDSRLPAGRERLGSHISGIQSNMTLWHTEQYDHKAVSEAFDAVHGA